MRIRTGFVSNSSSSSFLIYGACFGRMEDIKKILQSLDISDEEKAVTDRFDISEIIRGAPGPLDCEIGPDNYLYVGRCLTSIGDDETGAQFKASVQEALDRAFGEPTKCAFLSEAWYDG